MRAPRTIPTEILLCLAVLTAAFINSHYKNHTLYDAFLSLIRDLSPRNLTYLRSRLTTERMPLTECARLKITETHEPRSLGLLFLKALRGQ